MRTLEINKQDMWYALLLGKEEVTDQSRGTADVDAFGVEADYDRTFVTTDMSCPIKEDSIIWFDADPQTEPYNYTVYKIANSLNSITYAIRGVDVS